MRGNLTFAVTAVEPSTGFCEMVRRFSNAMSGEPVCYDRIVEATLANALTNRRVDIADKKWIVMANTLAAISNEVEGDKEARIYHDLKDVLHAAIQDGSSAYLTLIESSVTFRYLPRITEILNGLPGKLPGWRVKLIETVDADVPAPWLVRCKFFLSSRIDAQTPRCLCRHYEVTRA